MGCKVLKTTYEIKQAIEKEKEIQYCEKERTIYHHTNGLISIKKRVWQKWNGEKIDTINFDYRMLNNTFSKEDMQKGRQTASHQAETNEANIKAYELASKLRKLGFGATAIAHRLNERGYRTRYSNMWSYASVKNLFVVMDKKK